MEVSLDNLDSLDALQPPVDQMPSVTDERVISAASGVFKGNLGLTILNTGIAKMHQYYQQISSHTHHASDVQKSLKTFIQFQGKLSTTGDKDLIISEELRALSLKLKAMGIDTFNPEEKTLSRDRIAEIKANVGARIDELKTELQITFSTLIQPLITEMNSLMDILKTIEKQWDKVLGTFIANQVRR